MKWEYKIMDCNSNYAICLSILFLAVFSMPMKSRYCSVVSSLRRIIMGKVQGPTQILETSKKEGSIALMWLQSRQGK